MKAIIVSDLHIGSNRFSPESFETFLESLPAGYDLVLNGDIVHRGGQNLKSSHKRILELIRQESFNRKVVWVRGNHDHLFTLEDPGEIQFKRTHTIDKQLLIIHGDGFDKIRAGTVSLLRTIGFLEDMVFKPLDLVNLLIGIKPVFKFYRHSLMQNAVQYAEANNYRTIICGHSHYAEDITSKDIRYINTGAWVEQPQFYLLVNDGEMTLDVAGNREIPK
jgi:UDP-2,3-diacylglucosamine pyrophosphatase LpxH